MSAPREPEPADRGRGSGTRHRLVLAAYPPSFRDRYGDELDALLDDTGVGPREVLDLMLGAARAWLRPAYGVDPVERRRVRLVSTASTVWVAWCVVLCGTLGTLRLLEDRQDVQIDRYAPVWVTAHEAASVALLVAAALVTVGGGPLGARALRRSATVRRVMAGPGAALGACVVGFAFLAEYTATHEPLPVDPVWLMPGVVTWALAVVVTAGWWTVAVPRALRLCDPSVEALRLPAWCAVPASLALLVPTALLVAVFVSLGLGWARLLTVVAGGCVALVVSAAVVGVVSAARGVLALRAAGAQ